MLDLGYERRVPQAETGDRKRYVIPKGLVLLEGRRYVIDGRLAMDREKYRGIATLGIAQWVINSDSGKRGELYATDPAE